MLIDMHVHTIEGSNCSEVSLDETISLLKQKGFDGVLVTDHESETGYRSYFLKNYSFSGFTVLRGFEITTRYGDMLVVLPLDETILDLDEVVDQYIHPLELIKVVHERNGVIGIAHMFRENYGCIGNQVKEVHELETIVQGVDFIEVVNGHASYEANKCAEVWADKFEKAKIEGSDSHSLDAIGKCGTKFSIQIRNEEDLIYAIRNKLIVT